MDFLPFEIYSAPFPIDKYGMIWEIPNYLTEEELEIIQGDKRLSTPIPDECYPNTAFNLNWQSVKSQTIHRYAIDIFEYHIMHNHHNANYGFIQQVREYRASSEYAARVLSGVRYSEGDRESCEYILNERIQGSPKGMRLYPPHTDNGKLLTILVPLRPVKSVPTHFYGYMGEQKTVHIPWKINHAYLFCASHEYSYHGYEGDKYHDRWILNMNLFNPIEGGRKRPFNISNPGGWSRLMSSNKVS